MAGNGPMRPSGTKSTVLLLSAATRWASSAGPGAGKLVAAFSYSATCCCACAAPGSTLGVEPDVLLCWGAELELLHAAIAVSATAIDAAASAARRFGCLNARSLPWSTPLRSFISMPFSDQDSLRQAGKQRFRVAAVNRVGLPRVR